MTGPKQKQSVGREEAAEACPAAVANWTEGERERCRRREVSLSLKFIREKVKSGQNRKKKKKERDFFKPEKASQTPLAPGARGVKS